MTDTTVKKHRVDPNHDQYINDVLGGVSVPGRIAFLAKAFDEAISDLTETMRKDVVPGATGQDIRVAITSLRMDVQGLSHLVHKAQSDAEQCKSMYHKIVLLLEKNGISTGEYD